MKKISKERSYRRARQAKKKWVKQLRRKRFASYPHERYRLDMPKHFDLSSGFRDTIAAITQLKDFGRTVANRQIVVEIDFSKTERLSTAATLILSSEIDRILVHRYRMLRIVPYNLGNWDAYITSRLESFGFFGVLGLRIGINWPEDFFSEELTVVPAMACDNINPRRVQSMRSRLERIAKYFEHGMSLYEAMIEATGNAVEHAYPKDHNYRYMPLAGGTWWAIGVYSHSNHEVRVVVFDQGVGIPATLHRWKYAEVLREKLGDVTGGLQLFNDHARMIEAALEVSRTSRDPIDGRGQGLRDVVSPVEENGDGRVRILSGSGGVLYTSGERVELIRLPAHIGGTLIEWSLPVRAKEPIDSDDHTNQHN